MKKLGKLQTWLMPNWSILIFEVCYREWIDAIFNTQELSQDANLTREFESMLNQSLEMNSGDYEGVTEVPDELKDKDMNKDKAESEAYVCSICSVVCACPTVFESHLMGRRHAAKVKKHAEVTLSIFFGF